jgi:hypothetical protein
MSIRLLMLLLRVTQVLIGVAVGFVLLGFVVHVTQGGPFTANWPVVTTDALVHPLRAGAGTIRIDRDFCTDSAQACRSTYRQW